VPRPALEVADVFREHGPTWRKANVGRVSLEQLKVMSAIENCRTATLGGHVVRCDDCAHTLIAYNSCLMGKFRNGESTIDSVAKLTVFSVTPSRSTNALLSITTVDRRDPRSSRDRAVDDSTHSEGVAADWIQEILQPLNLHAPSWSTRISMRRGQNSTASARRTL
jgi:Transposase zinc-binding domain